MIRAIREFRRSNCGAWNNVPDEKLAEGMNKATGHSIPDGRENFDTKKPRADARGFSCKLA